MCNFMSIIEVLNVISSRFCSAAFLPIFPSASAAFHVASGSLYSVALAPILSSVTMTQNTVFSSLL